MALPNDGIAPDRFELGLRFAFGAVAGGFLAGALLLRFPRILPVVIIAGTGVGALVGGLLARHHGDRFWRALRGWITWR
jgi:hypothetical protein